MDTGGGERKAMNTKRLDEEYQGNKLNTGTGKDCNVMKLSTSWSEADKIPAQRLPYWRNWGAVSCQNVGSAISFPDGMKWSRNSE